MAFIIEKGIVPQTRKYFRSMTRDDIPAVPAEIQKDYKKRRHTIYPFGQLEVGDSFVICHKYTRELHQHYDSAARNYKNTSPNKAHWRFSVRRWNENEIRVWRVA